MVRRAIHSFYSKSYNELELFIHSCYFILSCLCANKSGINMDMYTDDNFKEFIDIAPYENIKTLENDYEDTYLFPSYSKVKALEKGSKVPLDVVAPRNPGASYPESDLMKRACSQNSQHLLLIPP